MCFCKYLTLRNLQKVIGWEKLVPAFTYTLVHLQSFLPLVPPSCLGVLSQVIPTLTSSFQPLLSKTLTDFPSQKLSRRFAQQDMATPTPVLISACQ